jgi:hypothetical protein
MQTSDEINQLEQGLVLQTLVDDNQSAYAYYSTYEENGFMHYSINLKSKSGNLIGDMHVIIVEPNKELTSLEHPYKHSKYLYIENMRNISKEKHVGNALHEYAFRMSIAYGAEGRIRFDAVRNTHIFHYKNGFLQEGVNDSDFQGYYLKMAEEMLKPERSTKNLGSRYLYLPRKRIDEYMKKYALSENLLTPSKEIIGEAHMINIAENIYLEVQQKSLALQLMLGLLKGCSPPTAVGDNMKSLINFLKSKTDCQKTTEWIDAGLNTLIAQLPLNTKEKQRQFELILVGTIILVMTFQDKKYGKQAIFNNEYLFPHISYDNIAKDYCTEKTTMTEFLICLGEDALNKTTLPFYETLHHKVFPGLQAIPEFSSLFNKYHLKEEISEEKTTKFAF